MRPCPQHAREYTGKKNALKSCRSSALPSTPSVKNVLLALLLGAAAIFKPTIFTVASAHSFHSGFSPNTLLASSIFAVLGWIDPSTVMA